MAKIDIDKLSLEVIKNLELYAKVTSDTVERAVKETAQETVKELRVTSPVGTGDYSRSWKAKRDTTARGKNKYNMIVYSHKPNYRLTHLLEKGHTIVKKGRTVGNAKAIPHIRNAEENAIERLTHKLLAEIKEV